MIMKSRFSKFGILLCLAIPFVSTSQTVNIGELAISTGTQMSSVGAIDNKTTGDIINDGELIVYSHFNNDGLVTFTPGRSTGITRMRGITGFQDISGTMPMEWYNAEFDNRNVQPGFHLSNELSISGQANFEKGIVDDKSYNGLLIFEKNATYINADDISHVNGLVQKNGSDAFRFPIGDKGKYRYAAISNPNAVTDSFAGQFFFENSNPLFAHSSKDSNITLIDNAEYWKIEKTAANSNVFLTLSWNTTTTPSAIYANPTDEIHIVRWDTTSNSWIDEGGVADSASREVTMVINSLTKYGVFTLARIRTNLDLEIFNAVTPNGDGLNDFFRVDGLASHPNNTVTIFNRWGVLVYETKSYGNAVGGNVFTGYSDGRVTVDRNERLPVGTYFYVIEAVNENDGSKTNKAGYLYINEK